MAKTLIDLDEALLAEATIALGAATKKDTVTQALQWVVDETKARRRAARLELQAMVDEGGFNFELLEELDQ
jgi:Arc/MetJ family transcription regulator